MLANMPYLHNASQAYVGAGVLRKLLVFDHDAMDNEHENESAARKRAIGVAVRKFRRSAGMTQAQLTSALSIARGKGDQGSISRIENGGGVSDKMLNAIAAALGVRVADIYAEAEDLPEEEGADMVAPAPVLAQGLRAVPLVSWVQAGLPTEIAEAMTRKNPAAWVRTTARVGRNAYALTVKGRSMTNPSGVPSFPEGSIIIVDPSRTPAHGALVVVRFDNDSEATFKRYEEDGGSKLLVPLNPSFPTIPIDRPATFCGVVVSRAEEEFS